MLQQIRDRAQGWIAWAIVILISIPFALWGIQEYMGVGSEPIIAKVNGEEITQREFEDRYRQFQRQLRDNLGAAFSVAMLDEEKLRKEVLEKVIQSHLILQESNELGLYASDAQVRSAVYSIPGFQRDGRFDSEAYERSLRYQGYSSPLEFEYQLRQSITTMQLDSAIGATSFVTPGELSSWIRQQEQKREFAYLSVPAEKFLRDSAPTEEQIQAYYEKTRESFRVPERVKLSYLMLDAETLGAGLPLTDEEIKAYFEQHQDEFGKPEQRRARHILIAVGESADEAAVAKARERAAEVVTRLRGGEDFAALAKEMSDDPGSASNGGDLGTFGRGVMDPAFEEATFSAAVGAISDPVRTPFGFHVIEVTEIDSSGVPQLEEVRDRVVSRLRRTNGEQVLIEKGELVADLSYENPDSLEPAADAVGIEAQTSDWITRTQGDGLLGSPKVLSAAFSDEVLVSGHNSELIELSPDRMIVLRVLEHEDARTQALEEVRERVEQMWRKDEAEREARKVGEDLLAKAKAGEALKELAEEAGFDFQSPEAASRGQAGLSMLLLRKVFSMARPSAHGRSSFAGQELENGDFAVVELLSVEDGDPKSVDDAVAEQERSQLRRQFGRDYYRHVTADLREQAKVEVLLP